MGWFGDVCSSIGSALGSLSSQSESENNAEYKKYAAEIKNFKIDPKVAQSVSSQKIDFQLSQIPDELDEIDSLDDVKKHFQEK